MCSHLTHHHSAVLKKVTSKSLQIIWPRLGYQERYSQPYNPLCCSAPRSLTVRLGEQTAEGLERVHVHWLGKEGKSQGKTWHCVLLPQTADTNETVSDLAEAQMAPLQASSREHQEEMETLMTGIYMILEPLLKNTPKKGNLSNKNISLYAFLTHLTPEIRTAIFFANVHCTAL